MIREALVTDFDEDRHKKLRKEQYQRAKNARKAYQERLKLSEAFQAKKKEQKEQARARRRELYQRRKEFAKKLALKLQEESTSNQGEQPSMTPSVPVVIEGGGQESKFKTPKPQLRLIT